MEECFMTWAIAKPLASGLEVTLVARVVATEGAANCPVLFLSCAATLLLG